MATEIRSQLDQGITLPFSWFADPAVFALEQERIFARGWQYAGPIDWVAEPGQYLTCRAGLVPVVVVRDHDGVLNGFVNICRHRATEVAQGRGRRETLQCPYHAWTYGLDGCLRAAPRSQLEPEFDRSQFGLLPVAVDIWGPLVFVNRDLDAAPLRDVLGGLPALLESCGFSFDGLRFRERRESVLAANWKAVVENFLECYHCPTAHPGFSKVIDVDPEAYHLSSDRWSSSQIGQVRREVLDGGGTPPYRPDRLVCRDGAFPLSVADVHAERASRAAERRDLRLRAARRRAHDDDHRLPVRRQRNRRADPRHDGIRRPGRDLRIRISSSRSSAPPLLEASTAAG